MAMRQQFAEGEFYHLYNRGTDKRNIFLSKSEYERFLALLYLANSSSAVRIENLLRSEQGRTLLRLALESERDETLVDIAAYCLMPNHFHLLIRAKDTQSVSIFMQKLLTGYTMYFNKRHERTGTLFQGKFKATHVNSDIYLKYLISYIHLNPIKLIEPQWKEVGIADMPAAERFIEQYAYSSYLDFKGQHRPEQVILERSSLPDYFETPDLFRQSITDWLEPVTNE